MDTIVKQIRKESHSQNRWLSLLEDGSKCRRSSSPSPERWLNILRSIHIFRNLVVYIALDESTVVVKTFSRRYYKFHPSLNQIVILILSCMDIMGYSDFIKSSYSCHSIPKIVITSEMTGGNIGCQEERK